MNYMLIIGAFVAIMLLYIAYVIITNNTLTSGVQALNSTAEIPYSKLATPASNIYCYQGWIYLNEAAMTSRYSSVFQRANTGGQALNSANQNKQIPNGKSLEFGMFFEGQTLKLMWGSGGSPGGSTVSSPPNTIMTVTDKFPLQKWVYFAFNVSSQNVVEAYLNGKLVKTVQASNLPRPNNQYSVYLGDTAMNGFLTKFVRTPTNMQAEAVWNTYLQGNGLNSLLGYLMPYNLNMAVSKDDIIQRQFRIF